MSNERIFSAAIADDPVNLSPFHQLNFGAAAIHSVPVNVLPDVLHGLELDIIRCIYLLESHQTTLMADSDFLYFRSVIGTAINVISRAWERVDGWSRWQPITHTLPPVPIRNLVEAYVYTDKPCDDWGANLITKANNAWAEQAEKPIDLRGHLACAIARAVNVHHWNTNYWLKQADVVVAEFSTDPEIMARALCVANDVDPDKESEGIGGVIPKGQKYKLWEAWVPYANAVNTVMAEEVT